MESTNEEENSPPTSLIFVTDGLVSPMPLTHSLAENPAAVYLTSLAPGSRRTMREALDTIADLVSAGRCPDCLRLDWSSLRYAETAAIRAVLAERYSAATVNKMLSALRGTLKAAWRLGLLSAEEYQRARDIDSVSNDVLPAGRSLDTAEIVALMAACQSDPTPDLGARDAAILALLYGCGLRRAEVVTLTVADCRVSERGTDLRVLGKRNKQRLVPLAGGAARAVANWLRIRGEADGPLFNPYRKGGRRQTGGLTTQAVYKMLQERARTAGVADFSPHDCRRTFVGDLLDRGADIVTVQKLAGHASVSTTARYDRRGETTKRRAAELLHVPYQG
ncbi:MAG: tyrosine-type recombinase/integrase [Armatimonadota bacterium]